jgi:hypothetical protein
MTKIKNKAIPQTNKNNKTKPENLMKKEYLEFYDKLKKDIQESTSMKKCFTSIMKPHFGASG